MTEKILSVSIAAYNVQDTLAEALVPFTAEGIREYVDVMIVNDGSNDNTAAIASEYVNQYPDTFRLINKKNGGWGSTLNVGVQEAKGKYLKQLDGDDFALERFVDGCDVFGHACLPRRIIVGRGRSCFRP